MSKQVYIVKNNQGEVIGARQSARAYTHALIINDMHVESFSSSERGARRAISKFFQYKDEAFKAAHSTAVVPVECVGEVKPVTLTAEGCGLTIKTFHAYKYAVIDTATGKVFKAGKTDGGMFYTLEAAQAFQADHDGYTVRRLKNADGSDFTGYVRKGDEIETVHTYSLKVVSIIDPRDAVEPAVEIAALKAKIEQVEERAEALANELGYFYEQYLNNRDLIDAQAAEIAALKAQVEELSPAPAVEPAVKPLKSRPFSWNFNALCVEDPAIKRAVWLATVERNPSVINDMAAHYGSEEQAYEQARLFTMTFYSRSCYEIRWRNRIYSNWYEQV